MGFGVRETGCYGGWKGSRAEEVSAQPLQIFVGFCVCEIYTALQQRLSGVGLRLSASISNVFNINCLHEVMLYFVLFCSMWGYANHDVHVPTST